MDSQTQSASALFIKDLQQLHDATLSAEQLHAQVTHPDLMARYLVGLHPNTSAESLRRLAADETSWVRESTAFNPNTPADLLSAYLAGDDAALWFGLAHNPALTTEQQLVLAAKADGRTLKALANASENPVIWQSIVANHNAAEESWQPLLALALASKSKSGKFAKLMTDDQPLCLQKASALHPNCPERFWPQFNHYLPHLIRQNPGVGLLMLETLEPLESEEKGAWKIQQLLSSGRGNGMVMQFLADQHPEEEIRLYALGARNVSIATVQRSLLLIQPNCLKRIAERRDLNAFLFHALANDHRTGVRQAIARNPDCPETLLQQLAHDKVDAVRVIVLNQYPHLAQGQVTGESEEKRLGMASNLDNPKLLQGLVKDESPAVRLTLAANPHCTAAMLRQLATDPEPEVRAAAAANNQMEQEQRNLLLDDPAAQVRASAINHSYWHNPKEDLIVRQHFATDPDGAVRAAAAYGLKDQTLLLELALDSDERVQLAVARYTKNPAIIARLGQTPFASVQDCLGQALRYERELYLATREQIAPTVKIAMLQAMCPKLDSELKLEWQKLFLEERDPQFLGLLLGYLSHPEALTRLLDQPELTRHWDEQTYSQAAIKSCSRRDKEAQLFWASQNNPAAIEALTEMPMYPATSIEWIPRATTEQRIRFIHNKVDLIEYPIKRCEPEIERLLLQDESLTLRQEAAFYFSSPSALHILALDPREEVQVALAKGFAPLAKPHDILRAWSENERCQQIKAQLEQHPSPHVQAIINNIWKRGYQLQHDKLRIAQKKAGIVRPGNLTRKELGASYDADDPKVRKQFMSHPACHLGMLLESLSDYDDSVCRAAATRIRQTLPLTERQEEILRRRGHENAAAFNIKLQIFIWSHRLEDRMVAARYITEGIRLETLLDDCPEVIEQLLLNQSLLPEHLGYLLEKADELRLMRIAGNAQHIATMQQEMPEQLQQLLQQGPLEARLLAITHCNDLGQLEPLKSDGEKSVSQAVSRRLKQLDKLAVAG
jgi:hypothetical protein